MTSGKYTAEFDAEAGCGFYANEDGSWTRMERPVRAQTQGVGKVTAITNAISPEYNNHGPIAGFWIRQEILTSAQSLRRSDSLYVSTGRTER